MARARLYCRRPLPARWLQKPVCTQLGWIALLSLSIFKLGSLVCNVPKLCVFNAMLHTSGNGVWRESMRYLWETYKQPGEPWQDWVASVMMQQQGMACLPLVRGTYESHHSVSLRAWEAFQALQLPGAPTNYWDWVELSIDCLNRPVQMAHHPSLWPLHTFPRLESRNSLLTTHLWLDSLPQHLWLDSLPPPHLWLERLLPQPNLQLWSHRRRSTKEMAHNMRKVPEHISIFFIIAFACFNF